MIKYLVNGIVGGGCWGVEFFFASPPNNTRAYLAQIGDVTQVNVHNGVNGAAECGFVGVAAAYNAGICQINDGCSFLFVCLFV